jgi:hypothetical protein
MGAALLIAGITAVSAEPVPAAPWDPTEGAYSIRLGSNLGRLQLPTAPEIPEHASTSAPEQAQPPALLRGAQVEIWALGWISTGRTEQSHDGSGLVPEAGNPTSTLAYKDIDSSIIEFGLKARWSENWFVRAAFGTGDITSGELIDDDFVSAQGATSFGTSVSGPHMISRTSSDVAGDSSLWYITLDVGSRLQTFGSGQGHLDWFGGLQYWREHYEAFGFTQLVCTAPVGASPDPFCNPVGSVGNSGQKLISNTVQWTSFRFGLAGDYRVSAITFNAEVVFIPYTRLFSEDTHHARLTSAIGRLRDPSFTMDGDGIGVQGEIGVSFRLIDGLHLNVGYRYWYLSVYDGTLTSHPASGGDIVMPLTDFDTVRHGIMFGAKYQF